MIVTTLLWWFFTGLLTWVFNLRTLLRLSRDAFGAAELAFKFGFHLVMFIVHVVGGAVSLCLCLYSKYRSFRGVRDES